MNFIIRRVKRSLNDSGVLLTIGKGIRYLFRKLYIKETYLIYRRAVRGEQIHKPCPEGVVLKVVEGSDAQALRQIEDIEVWLPDRLHRIMSRGLCIGAFRGPLLVGFNLVAFREAFFPPMNLKLRLRPDQAWAEQVTVLKAHRRQGLATALHFRAFAELQKLGIRRLYGGILASDTPALKAAEKAGYKPIAEVQYLNVLGRERRIWKKARHASIEKAEANLTFI